MFPVMLSVAKHLGLENVYNKEILRYAQDDRVSLERDSYMF
jgi:hypothetical protein